MKQLESGKPKKEKKAKAAKPRARSGVGSKEEFYIFEVETKVKMHKSSPLSDAQKLILEKEQLEPLLTSVLKAKLAQESVGSKKITVKGNQVRIDDWNLFDLRPADNKQEKLPGSES